MIETKFVLHWWAQLVMQAGEQSHRWHRPLARRRTALRWHRVTCELLGPAPGPSTAIPSFALHWGQLLHAVAASTNMSGGGESKYKNTWNMQLIVVSKTSPDVVKVNIYLHAVILVIHILDPRNELASIEAISDRFVLITLRVKTKLKYSWGNGLNSIKSIF